LVLTDVIALFTAVALVTAPAFYPRALLISLLALQFTQLFFGRSPALAVILSSTAGYIGLLVVASMRGNAIAWGEEGFLLALSLVSEETNRKVERRLLEARGGKQWSAEEHARWDQRRAALRSELVKAGKIRE